VNTQNQGTFAVPLSLGQFWSTRVPAATVDQYVPAGSTLGVGLVPVTGFSDTDSEVNPPSVVSWAVSVASGVPVAAVAQGAVTHEEPAQLGLCAFDLLDNDMEVSAASMVAGGSMPLFSGAHGDAAVVHLQRVRSIMVNTTSNHSGDPPVAVATNVWQASLAPDSSANSLYLRVVSKAEPILRLAAVGRFADREVYLDPSLADAVVEGCTDSTRRRELFLDMVRDFTSELHEAGRFLVDRSRKCLVPVPPHLEGLYDAPAAADAAPVAPDPLEAARQAQLQARLVELQHQLEGFGSRCHPSQLRLSHWMIICSSGRYRYVITLLKLKH
jgi:hypothetical protein